MYVCLYVCRLCLHVCAVEELLRGPAKRENPKTAKHRAAVKPPPQHPYESALTRSSPLFASSVLLHPQSIFRRLLLDVYTNRREMALSNALWSTGLLRDGSPQTALDPHCVADWVNRLQEGDRSCPPTTDDVGLALIWQKSLTLILFYI